MPKANVITPTIGRKVWFHLNGTVQLQKPGTTESGRPTAIDGQQFDATVVYVWNDRMVNLAVLDHYGNPFIATSVTMVQPGEPAPAVGYFAEWMPFQKGQAKAASEPTQEQLHQRNNLEYALVSGAAATVAANPARASDIAGGIRTLLEGLQAQAPATSQA